MTRVTLTTAVIKFELRYCQVGGIPHFDMPFIKTIRPVGSFAASHLQVPSYNHGDEPWGKRRPVLVCHGFDTGTGVVQNDQKVPYTWVSAVGVEEPG